MFSQLHPHPFNIDDPFTLCRKLYMGIQCRTSLHTWFPSCPKTLAAHSVHSLFGPFTIISLYVPLLLSGCSPWNKWKDDSQLEQLICWGCLQRRIRFGCHYQYFMTAVPLIPCDLRHMYVRVKVANCKIFFHVKLNIGSVAISNHHK